MENQIFQLLGQLTPDEVNKLLLSAVEMKSLTLAELAICLNADVTVSYNLPLMLACNKGSRDIADLLMKKGAELPSDRTSLLNTAYLNGSKEIIDLLLAPASQGSNSKE